MVYFLPSSVPVQLPLLKSDSEFSKQKLNYCHVISVVGCVLGSTGDGNMLGDAGQDPLLVGWGSLEFRNQSRKERGKEEE